MALAKHFVSGRATEVLRRARGTNIIGRRHRWLWSFSSGMPICISIAGHNKLLERTVIRYRTSVGASRGRSTTR